MPPPTLMPARADVVDARVAPRVEEPRLGPLLPEVADARAEEAAHLVPAGRDDRAGGRQADADVELPQRPPDAARQAELLHRDDAAGSHDASELAQRRGDVVDVAEEVRERQRVELGVGERERLGAALAQLDPLREARVRDPLAPGREHLRALVDPDDRALGRGARELDRDGGRAGGDVEHAACVRRDPRDEERAPARVLAEREEPGVTVVRRPERREQLPGIHAPDSMLEPWR